ncbi:hypothetical protein TNCV_4829941 [Trichonephila clavipes]|nr:hypothetical protein TNCV_4829941 [Trichonephila clavipes]
MVSEKEKELSFGKFTDKTLFFEKYSGDKLENLRRELDELEMENTSWESRQTATAGSDVVQSARPIFEDFFQHLWPYIGNNTANVVFQMVKRLWLIRIDQ